MRLLLRSLTLLSEIANLASTTSASSRESTAKNCSSMPVAIFADDWMSDKLVLVLLVEVPCSRVEVCILSTMTVVHKEILTHRCYFFELMVRRSNLMRWPLRMTKTDMPHIQSQFHTPMYLWSIRTKHHQTMVSSRK